MPVLPSEEVAESGIFDKVAKEPSKNTESTASDKVKAEVKDFQANPGPVIPEAKDLPPVASKEELKARSEELNK
ncbi:hypothetical protein L228DRAFT_270092 [Xylona heveae TC161]|uniref:Uncharacterized protein n=1 Tax=Xylona heveae (strain CBS 132557 / TC161) TaxID=1328760 RepID=A0A165FC80_XYLHT|nr:hypothetical protein L228DRAFT_270092 [Xylona heveae TC161]KZF20813.1 hypothetical protein L228DRAFT_270092 [Xylona heveae TC161]